MNEMNCVIIESPYAGDVTANLIYARRALADSLARGEAPFASHLLYPQVLDDSIYTERDLGITCGWAWAEWSDVIVFYIDYGMSSGMQRALARYEELDYQIEYRTIGLNP